MAKNLKDISSQLEVIFSEVSVSGCINVMLTVGLDLLQKNFMAKRALVDKICVLNSKLEMTIKDNKIKESLNRRVKQIINRDLILSESSSILSYIKFRAYNDTDQSWEEFLEALASNSNVLQEIHSKGILISSFVHFSCLLQSTCIITTEHLERTQAIYCKHLNKAPSTLRN